MRVAIVGAGAIGGYFGAQLIKAGHSVNFVTRGITADSLKMNGLELQTDAGVERLDSRDFKVTNVEDYDSQSAEEIVFVCVKTYSNDSIVHSLERLVGSDTWVITLQNGLQPVADLKKLGIPGKIIQGIAYIEATQTSPGVYLQEGEVARIVYGADEPSLNIALTQLESLFSGSSVEFNHAINIVQESWKKFTFIASVAGITACTRKRLSTLLSDRSWQAIMESVVTEITHLADISGGDGGAIRREVLKFINENQQDIVASMHTDVSAGRPLELEALTGKVCSLGRTFGVDTPLNKVIYGALEPFKYGTS